MTIGKKIGIGFGAVVTALVALAAWSYHGITGIVGLADEVIHGNQLSGEMTQRELDHLNWTNGVNELLTNADVTELNVQTDPHKCAFGKWYYGEGRKHAENLVPAIHDDLVDVEEWHTGLHESAGEIGKLFKQADIELSATLAARKCDHLAWMHKIKDAFLDNNTSEINVQMDPTKCKFGTWLYSDEVTALRKEDPELNRICTEIDAPHRALHESAAKINELLAKDDRDGAMAYFRDKTSEYATATCAHIDEIIDWNDTRIANMQAAQNIYATKTKPALDKVQHYLDNVRDKVRENITTDEAMLASAARTETVIVIVAVASVILAVVIAIGIVVSTKHILSRIASALGDGAEQVNDAASQVASASQQLAESATEQASALEETSASLEEMAAMTRTNAENAKRANELSNEAKNAAINGDQTMNQLNDAMNGINESSERINSIIRVIEEIAFQTNLLALNAAVEAARAGEEGKGFAVVAEEVRNLAKRAAEAAKESTGLIQESAAKARQGSEIASSVGTALGSIVGSVDEVTKLVDSITQASSEQAKGIDHISSAVSQIDKGTQQTASGTEESASASEELAAQAESVKEMVDKLHALIFGEQGGHAGAAPRHIKSKPTPRKKDKSKAVAAGKTEGHGGGALGLDDDLETEWKSSELDDAEWTEVADSRKSNDVLTEF